MKAREGDLVETGSQLIFDVKGLIHPPRKVIAFPRFIPDSSGNREYKQTTYKKIYSLSRRFEFLEEKIPHLVVRDTVFDERLCEVPTHTLKEHYKPAEKLMELRGSNNLDKIEGKALQLAELLKETADIPWDGIGISGSIMVGIHTPHSDIDPIIYGSENCRKVYSALKELLNDQQEPFKPYTQEGLKGLFDFRSKDTMMSYEDFVRTESRKVMQGKFLEKDYFIRFVKDWSEVGEKYGDVHYVNVGYAKVKSTVVDDSQSIFTPCVYKISDVQILEGSEVGSIEEIASFRGRFCEQAREGEIVIAQGKIERVVDSKKNREYFRLLLGNKPSDYMALA